MDLWTVAISGKIGMDLSDKSKEWLINHAKLFQAGLKMWRELYREEVGEERYKKTLMRISGNNND